jgi:hypothetical protein
MTDAAQLATIKQQALELIAELTLNAKPSYVLDGQQVSWEQYLTRLQATVDWCDRKLGEHDPFEIQTQGLT